MLRPIKTNVSRPRLIAFAGETLSADAVTITVGKDEASYVGTTADAQLAATFRNPFYRNIVAVATPGASIGNGGTVRTVGGAVEKNLLAVRSVDGGGTADLGNVECLALGFDSLDTNSNGTKLNLFNSVASSFRSAFSIGGQVSSAGAKNIGGSTFTCVKDSTGNYTVTFSRAFGRIPVVVATPVTTTAGFSVHIKTKANNQFTVATFNAANSAADCAFNFFAYGSSSNHEHRVIKGADVEIGFRKPRMLAFRVAYTAGAPAITIGGVQGTVTDTAVGRLTINYAEAFAREPIVLATIEGSSSPWATVHTSSSSSCLIEASGTTGTLGDPTGVHVIVIGSDDASEY